MAPSTASSTPLAAHLATCHHTHAQVEVTDLSLPDCGRGDTVVYRIDLGKYNTRMGYNLPPADPDSDTSAYRLVPGLYALPYHTYQPFSSHLQLIALVRQDGTPLGPISPLQWLQKVMPGLIESFVMLRDAELGSQRTDGKRQSAVYGSLYEPTQLVTAVRQSLITAYYGPGLAVDHLPGRLFCLQGKRLAGSCLPAVRRRTA